jgi:hypothetical protein
MEDTWKITVSTAADTFDLTTIDAVKLDMNITGTASDAQLLEFIHEQSAAIATSCNRVFAQETVVETGRIRCPLEVIKLRRYPGITITSIVDDDETLDSDEYEVDDATGLLYRLDGDDNREYWYGPKIVITYQAGYELLDGVPRELEVACRRLVTAQWQAKGRDPLVKSVTVDGIGRRDYWVGGMPGDNGAMPPDVLALISPFRNLVV